MQIWGLSCPELVLPLITGSLGFLSKGTWPHRGWGCCRDAAVDPVLRAWGNWARVGLWVSLVHRAAAQTGPDAGEIPIPRRRDNPGTGPWRWGISTSRGLQSWPGSPQSGGGDSLTSFISHAEFLCISSGLGWAGTSRSWLVMMRRMQAASGKLRCLLPLLNIAGAGAACC